MFRTIFRILVVVFLSVPLATAGPIATVTAVRLWPAADYTRLTIEATSEISQKMILLKKIQLL
jgi:hypothetical protein